MLLAESAKQVSSLHPLTNAKTKIAKNHINAESIPQHQKTVSSVRIAATCMQPCACKFKEMRSSVTLERGAESLSRLIWIAMSTSSDLKNSLTR